MDASHLKLVLDQRGVVFEEPGASYVLRWRERGIYTSTFDIPGWYRFEMDYAFFPAGQDQPARFRGQFYGEPADYFHVPQWQPGSSSTYTGTYDSEELQVRYQVRLEQGQLIVDDGRLTSALLPMGPQEFQASKTLRVLRFANGEPAMEFSLFTGGARDLRFKRVDAQQERQRRHVQIVGPFPRNIAN